MNTETLANLTDKWTAEVELKNGQVISIWYTAFYSTKHIIKSVLSVASDYPRKTISIKAISL